MNSQFHLVRGNDGKEEGEEEKEEEEEQQEKEEKCGIFFTVCLVYINDKQIKREFFKFGKYFI